MLPAPAKQVVKMAPRAEDRVAKLKESQPDFRPTTHTTDAKSKKLSQTAGTMMVYDVGHEKGTEAVQPLGVHIRDSSEPQLPKPVNTFSKMIPRDSKPAKKPDQDKPQAPPAQVVGAKDEVLSHSPRDSKKAPQVPPAQVMGAKDDVFSHAPRDSKAAQPQVPPAQVVGAKDEVLSHAPRAHDKNQKQTPLSTVQGAVEVSSFLSLYHSLQHTDDISHRRSPRW